jgi:hypothetical protein
LDRKGRNDFTYKWAIFTLSVTANVEFTVSVVSNRSKTSEVFTAASHDAFGLEGR